MNEVTHAINKITTNYAPGPGGMAVNMLKIIAEKGMQCLIAILNAIYIVCLISKIW